jgi:hypothetical protein
MKYFCLFYQGYQLSLKSIEFLFYGLFIKKFRTISKKMSFPKMNLHKQAEKQKHIINLINKAHALCPAFWSPLSLAWKQAFFHQEDTHNTTQKYVCICVLRGTDPKILRKSNLGRHGSRLNDITWLSWYLNTEQR